MLFKESDNLPGYRGRMCNHTVGTFSTGDNGDFHVFADPLDFLPVDVTAGVPVVDISRKLVSISFLKTLLPFLSFCSHFK